MMRQVSLTRSEKLSAILAATSQNDDGDLPHPHRRFRAGCNHPGSWRVYDAFYDRFLTDEEVDALTVAELLQEFAPRKI